MEQIDPNSAVNNPAGGAAAGGDDPTPPALSGGNPPAPAPPDDTATENPPVGGEGKPAGENTNQPKPTQNQGVVLDGKGNTGAGEDGGQEGGGEDGGEGDYAFNYPDGYQGLPGVEVKLKEYAKAKGYSQEQAQELAQLSVDATQEYFASVVQAQHDLNEKWTKELEADQEFGGVNLKRTSEDANKALNFFAPELIKKLPEYNLMREPDLIRAFARIGRTLRENTSPKGRPASEGKPKTIVEEKEAVLASIAGK